MGSKRKSATQKGKPVLRVGERVYEGMRERIRNFDLEPGSRLDIEEIAETYNASTIPVREALARLAAEVLIDHEPRIGFMAPRISLRRVVDNNTVLFLFLRHMTDLHFEGLHETHQLIPQKAGSDDHPEGVLTAMDRGNAWLTAGERTPEQLSLEVEQLIESLLSLVQSPKLVGAVRAALDSSHYYRTVFFGLSPVPEYVEVRYAYADALRSGDENRARELVRALQHRFAEGSREVCGEVALMVGERAQRSQRYVGARPR